MICILHGYLLEGSGSNLWTRAIVSSLCQQGQTVHLVCQEHSPENYDFIGEAYQYRPDGKVELLFKRPTPCSGHAIFHRPQLGDLLPVYVRDRYLHFSRVVPMVDLSDDEIEEYLQRNEVAIHTIMQRWEIRAFHVNHAVLLSVVAQRIHEKTGVSYAVMPHGSAIEYAIKKDPRLFKMGEAALKSAGRVFVIGREMRARLNGIFDGLPGLDEKTVELPLGVDTREFQIVEPDRRAEQIERIPALLKGLPRGRTRQQSAEVTDCVSGKPDRQRLRRSLHAVSEAYDGKLPDSDLENKLGSINWREEKILLYVGRLIAAKGFMSILTALPEILAIRRDIRLVAVGHGPLREVAEAFLSALAAGKRDWAEKIVAWGSILEKPAAEFLPVSRYFDSLRRRGTLTRFFENAHDILETERVIFTGYLTHRELSQLFPLCDVAVFPSVVAEAGPFVFLEALASGCFPMGTYFGGMAANIDAVSRRIPRNVNGLMKLRTDPEHTIGDIISKVPDAIRVGGDHKQNLRQFVEDNHEWRSIAAWLSQTLTALSRAESLAPINP